MFAHRELRDHVGLAVTDRSGGVSASPWASLNLGDHVGDDPAHVEENRRRLAAAVGVGRLVTMRQVHGAGVAVVDDRPTQTPEADALVTTAPGLGLVVLVADCTPILLADPGAGVLAAVHAGRKGLAAGVLGATIRVMTDLGARADRVRAVVGPGICPEHYAVPADMRAEVEALAPGSAASTVQGAPALDIRAGLLRQLDDAGVRAPVLLSHCTAEDDRFFSHRRDGVTGRFAGVIWRTT